MPEIIESQPPKWVMCLLCGDVIWGGPSIHPMPRECSCKATVVVPRIDRGYVRWDAERYKAAGETEPEIEYAKPGEVLQPTAVSAPPTRIDDIYTQHMGN